MKKTFTLFLYIVSIMFVSAQTERMRIYFPYAGTIQEYSLSAIGKIDFYEVGELNPKGSVANYVDLGLSVKWATWNVGATNEYDYGGSYAWGDISGNLDDYISPPSSLSSISGTSYDVSTNMWGSSWRMPTKDEMQELIDNCTWEYEFVNDIAIAKVIGKNGNYIILPLAGHRYGNSQPATRGYGYYWTGDKYNYLYSYRASNVIESTTSVVGHSIRPVYIKKEEVPSFKVSTTSISLAQKSGSTAKFSISGNVDWIVTSKPDWISISSQTGHGDNTITVTALSDNESSGTRTGKITIANVVTGTTDITVSQSGAGISFEVVGTPVSLGAQAGASATFTVKTNAAFSITNVPSWLEVTPQSGNSTTTITVKALNANPSTTQRTATIYISNILFGSYSVVIKQEGSTVSKDLTTMPNDIVVLSNGMAYDVKLGSDVAYYYKMATTTDYSAYQDETIILLMQNNLEKSTGTGNVHSATFTAGTTVYVYMVGFASDGSHSELYKAKYTAPYETGQPYVSVNFTETYNFSSKIKFTMTPNSYTSKYYVSVRGGAYPMSTASYSDAILAFIMKQNIDSNNTNSYSLYTGSSSRNFSATNTGYGQVQVGIWGVNSNGSFSTRFTNSCYPESTSSSAKQAAHEANNVLNVLECQTFTQKDIIEIGRSTEIFEVQPNEME